VRNWTSDAPQRVWTEAAAVILTVYAYCICLCVCVCVSVGRGGGMKSMHLIYGVTGDFWRLQICFSPASLCKCFHSTNITVYMLHIYSLRCLHDIIQCWNHRGKPHDAVLRCEHKRFILLKNISKKTLPKVIFWKAPLRNMMVLIFPRLGHTFDL